MEIDKEMKNWCKEYLDVDPEELIEHIYETVETGKKSKKLKKDIEKDR